jgi:hypothetical protein
MLIASSTQIPRTSSSRTTSAAATSAPTISQVRWRSQRLVRTRMRGSARSGTGARNRIAPGSKAMPPEAPATGGGWVGAIRFSSVVLAAAPGYPLYPPSEPLVPELTPEPEVPEPLESEVPEPELPESLGTLDPASVSPPGYPGWP